MNRNRKGLAIVVVMAFAFGIAIIMFAMIQSNSNLTNQTKKTIYQMQASYLAQSCVQYAKLHIYLLPKEMYSYFQNNSKNPLDECISSNYKEFAMGEAKNDYDLFQNNKAPADKFPYKGGFRVKELKYVLSNENMKMVQDNYHIVVDASVNLGNGKLFEMDPLKEDFIVSRFSGR